MSRRWGINFWDSQAPLVERLFRCFFKRNSNFIGLKGCEMLEVWTVASFDIFLLGKTASNSIDGRYSLASGHYRPVGKASTMPIVKHRWSEFSSFSTRKSYILWKRPPPTLPPILIVQWKVCSYNLSFLSWEERLSAKSAEKCQNLKVLAICWSGSVLHVKISALAAWCSRC